MELGRTRRLRWALPAGAVMAVAALIAGTEAATAQPAPSLPSRTAAQLVAGVATSRGPVPLTGTYTETANLGLPSLPGGSDPLSGLALLSGTHTFMIWSGGPRELRIAEPVQLGEADVRQSGNQVWLWDSRTQQATNIILPATITPAGSASSSSASSSSVRFRPAPPGLPLTPQQLGRRILAAVGPTTVVSVQDNVTVAGQPAYQLALVPKDTRSLIGQVKIAIDARHHLPLRVQVFARGASAPAVQAGYTALSFGAPAASNFTFTPPPGAKVKTINVPARTPHPHLRGRPRPPAGSVIIDPATGRPAAGPGAGRRSGPVVLGTGWLAVAAVPPAGTAGPAAAPAVPRALMNAAVPVHGAWGSGRLLRTSLFSVLFTSSGTVLAGAVTPAVLYADVAAVK